MFDSPQVYHSTPATPASPVSPGSPAPPALGPGAPATATTAPHSLSLEQKLPLIVAGLLLAVMAAISVASYVEVRATTRQMADERLVNHTSQVASLFNLSGPLSAARARAHAAHPALVTFAKSRTAANREAALAALRSIDANPQAVIETQLVDRDGRLVLSTRPAAEAIPVAEDLPPAIGDSVRIGRLRPFNDTLVWPTATAVKGSDRLFVVRWRRIVITEPTRNSLARLFGTYATPYLGNPGGTGWVNLYEPDRTVIQPYDFNRRGQTQTVTRDGKEYLAATLPLDLTPWAVVLEVPMERVLAPVSLFLRRFMIIGLVALAIALVVAWRVTRSVTRPILQLADSATALAAGDFARAVRVNRTDELGEIGQAFSRLASEVQTTRQQLESKVLERTRDLNDALYRLHGAHESLVRRERLAFLGQLASGVGHELRNPLGVMQNSVYYLRAVLEDQPQHVREYLDILNQQIMLSEKIVGDLLDFARSKPPQRQPMSLSEVSERQVARLGPVDGVTIESSLNGHLPAVLADRDQVSQIVLNLLTNAVQAVDGDGAIAISAAVNGDRVHLEVADTGPGIPPENMERVFEPLFTTKARGIGLGLAVSRTLARANGGDISAGNRIEGGAVFRLTLPVALAESAAVGAGAA